MHYRMRCHCQEDFSSLRFPLIGNLLHRLQGPIFEFDHDDVGTTSLNFRAPQISRQFRLARNPPFSIKETNNIVLLAPFTFRSFVLWCESSLCFIFS
jgi:hypothetical protein